MAFTQKTLNGFEMTRRSAACEIPAKHPGNRAFVGAYPPLPDKNIQKWRVKRFELPEHLLEKYFGEEDLVDSEFLRLDTIEQVEEVLASWNIDTSVIDAPWHSAYPL
jgi:hypothetical protein